MRTQTFAASLVVLLAVAAPRVGRAADPAAAAAAATPAAGATADAAAAPTAAAPAAATAPAAAPASRDASATSAAQAPTDSPAASTGAPAEAAAPQPSTAREGTAAPVAGAAAAPPANVGAGPAAADVPPAPPPPPAPAAASSGARALAVVPPAGPPRVDWYAPQDLDLADANLDWNSSMLGGFDPWTKQKVTILFQSQALALTLPGGEGMTEYDQPDGTTAKNQYPDARFSGSYPAVRLEWGNWSLSFAQATGTLDWGVDDGGTPMIQRATTYEAVIARGFGAWAFVDTVGDLRIGISWPELFVRVVYGKYEGDPGMPIVEQAIVGAGVSMIGLRATFGDLLFGEIRAGEWAYHVAGAQIDFRDGTDKDVLIQQPHGFSLRPTFRIGFVL